MELLSENIDKSDLAQIIDNSKVLIKLLLGGYYTNQAQTMELFLKLGANPNINKDSETALIIAVKLSRTDAVKVLLKAGADVNAQGYGGSTALMYAMPNNKPDISSDSFALAQKFLKKDILSTTMAAILLEAGADFTLQNYKGQAALDVAKENKRQDIVKLLKKHNKQHCYVS